MLVLIHYGEGDEKWNGVGGVVNDVETPEDAVVREISEEIDVHVDKKDLQKVKVLNYPELELHVYLLSKWSGEIKLIDTSLKQFAWFDQDKLPFGKMWPDNKDWLPQVLRVI